MDWNNIAKSDSDEHGLHFFATACDTLPTTTKNQLGQDLFGKSISSSWARDEHHHTDLVMKAEYFIHARQILDTLCESYHVDSNSDKLIRTSSPRGEFIRNRYSNKCSSLLTGTHPPLTLITRNAELCQCHSNSNPSWSDNIRFLVPPSDTYSTSKECQQYIALSGNDYSFQTSNSNLCMLTYFSSLFMTHYSSASHNTLVPIRRALTFLFVLPALLILCFSSTVLSSPLLLALAHIPSGRRAPSTAPH